MVYWYEYSHLHDVQSEETGVDIVLSNEFTVGLEFGTLVKNSRAGYDEMYLSIDVNQLIGYFIFRSRRH